MNRHLQHRTTTLHRLGIAVGGIALGVASIGHAADLNGDGLVNATDQSVLLASWGECPAPCPSDLNGDGVVDGVDFAILLDAASTAQDEAEDSGTVESEDLYAPGDSTATTQDDETFGSTDPITSPTGEELVVPVHNVPLPAPVWIGVAGLAGAVLVRRRWLGAYA